jgi:pilus assembly protein FimV
MMNKNALRVLIASALLSPTSLYALGLGEIRLNSALNQPFDADIDVVSVTADELSSVKVALASADAFRRYGLDRPSFLSGFTLRVEGDASRPVIKLRSTNAVSEPFVSLLVDVSWSGGRVLREYTVLLDPPVFAQTANNQEVLTPRGQSQTAAPASGNIERAPAPSAATEQAPASAPTQTTAPVPAPTQTTPSPAPVQSAAPKPPAPVAPRTTRTVAAPAATTGGNNYKVVSGDSLSKIAGRLNADDQVTNRQMMVALYRANPQAFADDNMNILRAGSVLRIPPTADVVAISESSASAEVSRQYGVWRSANNAASSQPVKRLRLVPAEQGGTATGNDAAKQAAAKAAADKAAAEQQAAAKAAEAKRLLDLKNAELAQMQKRLADAKNAMAASSSVASAEVSSATATSETATQAQVSSEPAAEPTPIKKPAAAPAQEAPGLLDTLSDYGLYLAAAGVLVIGGLLALFMINRRKSSSADTDSTAATMTASDFDVRDMRDMRSRALDQRDDQESGDEPDTEDSVSIATPARVTTMPAAAAISSLSEDTLSSETALHIDQQDALAEADFHMAYGLYDQAADIVKLAIERQPQRRELKLKLAEIFFVWGNKDDFLETARGLHATQDEAEVGEWDKVLIMGKQICPEDPLFSGDIAGSRAAGSVDVNLEGGEHHVDIDLFAAPSGEQPKHGVDFELAQTGQHQSPPGGGLDFLLDEPQRGNSDYSDNEPTREMDANARTQETPTIESPYLHDLEQGADRTAEISLDEIGLNDELHPDLRDDALETTGTVDDDGLGDDGATRLAALDSTAEMPGLNTAEMPNFGADATKTMLAPHMEIGDELNAEGTETIFGDHEIHTGNTITVEQIDLNDNQLAGRAQADSSADTGMFKATQKLDLEEHAFDFQMNDTASQQGISETGIFRATQKIDMDLDRLADPHGSVREADTVKTFGRDRDQQAAENFSQDVFGIDETGITQIDRAELSATELMKSDMSLQEMEPVTMSEVGTKLDLARAYMDMGDPDGARSILQEVLDEGNAGQKQEAQRLLDSIG